MAAVPIVLTNAKVLVNAVDLSAWCRSVKIHYSAEVPETTAMGATSKTRLPSLKDWSMDLEFNQDFAGAAVDATLFPLVGAAAFTVDVQPVNGARSVTNPSFTGLALLQDYPPLGQKVGEVAVTTIKVVGAGVMSRLTA